jgi:uncharacterized protein (DUF952 family)
MLYHITPRSQWQQAQKLGRYCPESLEIEGFIHCSTQSQVLATANRFFKGQTDLLLLGIDPDRVQLEIRYELADDNLFPHLYGPLNLDAIVQVWQWTPDVSGVFTVLPEVG